MSCRLLLIIAATVAVLLSVATVSASFGADGVATGESSPWEAETSDTGPESFEGDDDMVAHQGFVDLGEQVRGLAHSSIDAPTVALASARLERPPQA